MVGGGADDPMRQSIGAYDAAAAWFVSRYDQVAASAWIPVLAARHGLGARVLDVGCGSGRDTRAFTDLGATAIALDASQAMLDVACADRVGICLRADLRSLPIATGSIDVVWCQASLVHVPPEATGAVLSELVRVLDTGGHLFIAVPCADRDRYERSSGGARWMRRYVPADLVARLAALDLQVEHAQRCRVSESLEVFEVVARRLGDGKRTTRSRTRSISTGPAGSRSTSEKSRPERSSWSRRDRPFTEEANDR